MQHKRESSLYYLKLLFKNDVADIWALILYTFSIGILYLVIPITVQQLVNTFAFGTLVQPILVLSLVILIGISAAGVLNILRFIILELLQQRLFSRLAMDVSAKIPRLDIKVFREAFAPAIINRFFEITIVQKTLSKITIDGITVVIQSLIGLIILGAYHPVLLGISILLFIVVLGCMRIVGPHAVDSAIEESSAKHEIIAWLENLYMAPLTLKSRPGRVFGLERTANLISDYLSKRKSHFRFLMANHSVLIFTQVFSSTGILAVGGYLLVNQQLTLGQLVAAELVVSALVSNLTKFTYVLESFYDLIASSSKIDSLIKLDEEQEFGYELSLTDKTGLSVSLENVLFLNSENQVIFNDLTLNLDAGSHTVIYGNNGSGKTLLASIILKFKTVQSGTVKINDLNIKDLNVVSIRNTILMLEQEQVFQGTIEDNLRLGHKELTHQEIADSLKKVGLDKSIGSLPKGIRTEINLSGWPLSRGQVKLLMFARAILLKPRMIIIDDALQGIDTEHIEDFILPLLKDSERPWTVLFLTLDKELAQKFNDPLMIKDGKILKLEQ